MRAPVLVFDYVNKVAFVAGKNAEQDRRTFAAMHDRKFAATQSAGGKPPTDSGGSAQK
jgi:hypothetical protein